MTPAALDIAIGILILISTIAACVRGLIREVFTLGGFAIAVLTAWTAGHLLVPPFNKWLGVTEEKQEKVELVWGILSPELAAKVAAYGGVFLMVFLTLTLIGFLISRWIREAGIGIVDRLLGGLFGFLRGLMLVFIVYIPFVYLVDQKKFPAWAKESFSVPVLQATLNWANKSFELDKMIEDRGNGIAIKFDKVNLDKINEDTVESVSPEEKELQQKIIQEEKEIQKDVPPQEPAPESNDEILPPIITPPSFPAPSEPPHDNSF